MKTFLSIPAAVLLFTACAAENLLKADFSKLDQAGKNAGFQTFRAQVETEKGKKFFSLDLSKNQFVTLPVKITAPGIYTFSGICSGDADSVYAKLTVNGKVVTRSIRQKYMKKTSAGDLRFSLELLGVPAGDGILFISPRGQSGKLSLKEIKLEQKKNQPPVKIIEKIHAVPQIIDSDSERIEKSAAMDITGGWEIRNPEDKRLQLLPADKVTPGVLEVIFDTHTGKLEKRHFPYNFRTGRLTCRLDRSIDLPPEVWTKYNQISVMVKPLCSHDRSHLWFDVLGAVGHQSAVNMKGNQWNKISICWNNLSPERARKLTGISFGFGGFGTPIGEERYTRFLFKDFKLEKVVVGTETTWNVSPEKIVVPQTGFSPGENKQALFSASHKADDFALVSNGRKVFSGKLVTEKFLTGTFKIARFTEFTRPGTYRIISGNLRSVPFKIGYDHLKEAAAKSRYFMNCMRLGCTTPLFPKHAQLADDARRSDTGEQVDVSGGWCDAADLCGFHAMAATSITRPLARSLYRFNIPEMQSETYWGGKLLNKLFEPGTGLPYTVMNHFGIYRSVNNINRKNPDPKTLFIIKNNGEWTMNKYYTDGKPGTGDERGIHFAKTDGAVSPHDRQDFHYGITAASNWLHLASRKDKMFDKAVSFSRRHFERLEKSNDKQLKADGIIPYDRKFSRAQLLRLENHLALFIATGKEVHRKAAARLVTALLEKQERFWYKTQNGQLTGWFNSYRPRSTAYEGAGSYADVLSLYAENCALKEEYLKIHAALRIYADGYAANPEFRTRPYNMIYPVMYLRPIKHWGAKKIAVRGKHHLYGNFRRIFLSGATGTLALDLLCAGNFLRDLQCQYAASETLRFNLGENQSARSLMTEVGVNFNRQLMSTNLGWIPGMMGHPDITDGVAQLPYNRNCGRYEVYTQAQGVYTAALTVLSSNALLSFKGAKNVELKDCVTGKIHKSTNGRISVPGGTVYQVKAAGFPAFALPVISGEKREITLKADLVFIEQIAAEKGNVKIVLLNPSKKAVTVRLNVFADNANVADIPAITLAANGKKIITLPVAPVNKELAAAAVFYVDNDFRNARSVLVK